MKKLLLHFALVFIVGTAAAQIQFREISYDAALKAAKAEGKMVFIDCYTSWCGPCKMLAKNVFPTQEAGDYFNPRFVSLKVDMEKGEGPALQKRFDVGAFPTLLFLDAEGEIVYRLCGAKASAKALIDDVEQGLKDRSLTAMQKRFEQGERTSAFVTEYLQMLEKLRMFGEINKVAAAFLQDRIEEIFTDKTTYQIFENNIASPESPVFQKVYAQKDRLKKAYGPEALDHLEAVWMQYPYKTIAKKADHQIVGMDQEKMAAYSRLMKQYQVASQACIEAYYRMREAVAKKNAGTAIAAAGVYADYAQVDDHELLQVYALATENQALNLEQKNVLNEVAAKRIKALKAVKDTSGRTVTVNGQTMTWPEHYAERYAEYLKKL